ncbi:MAG TPA: NAD(P)-binding domain-containing protein [Gemmatimonadaceae bacterium]|nr:NAD(P)-binding domain-containing protein [Gemmatimonadaceae bacterium]
MKHDSVDVVIVGAGPCGLAAAVSAQRAGFRTTVIERTCVVSGIASYPTYITFFSTPAKLAIGGVPFVLATEKPTRRDALAYYRAVVEYHDLDVRQYETVVAVERLEESRGPGEGGQDSEDPESTRGREVRSELAAGSEVAGGRGGPPPKSTLPSPPGRFTTISPPLGARFRVRSVERSGAERTTDAHAVVVATGYFGAPNRLDIPGEELPHVTHLYREGHEAFRRNAVVVGGGNSAVEAALDLHRSGARVTLVHFGPDFDRNIKPWVLPTIEARMDSGEIGVRWNARLARVDPEFITLQTETGEERIPADHVYLMLGYQPEIGLLQQLGVPIDQETGVPRHDPATMETAVPGVFISGVIASGFDANKTFIENGRFHGDLIARRLTAEDSPGANPSPS